ncbi:hypothetical protein [Beijerinckia sp. L45]|uniref:hypothetical protein n=1 Tax=Beijerinckia sp. L45 TaxID=1641855 RepID=UPI00131D818A|nr:hypothetical protein [Beijerinckia sp. L45]
MNLLLDNPLVNIAPIELPSVSSASIDALVADINTKGFAEIKDYISPQNLADMRGVVNAAVQRSKGEYVAFTGANAVRESIFERIAQSDDFKSLMRRLYVAGTGRSPPETEFYQVLRCLCGKSAVKHSLNFHYDSYVVTALIPVEIPKTGKSGDLIMLANFRDIRNSYFANVIDKILLDNKVTQTALRLFTNAKLLPLKRIKPEPGSIYFFWGYRSIHTNEACDQDKVRATALYHYANPHAG